MSTEVGTYQVEALRSSVAAGANLGTYQVEVLRGSVAAGANVGTYQIEALRSSEFQPPVGSRLWAWSGTEWLAVTH